MEWRALHVKSCNLFVTDSSPVPNARLPTDCSVQAGCSRSHGAGGVESSATRYGRQQSACCRRTTASLCNQPSRFFRERAVFLLCPSFVVSVRDRNEVMRLKAFEWPPTRLRSEHPS